MPPPVNPDCQRTAHHSIFLQEIRYISLRSPVRHIHEYAFRRKALVRFGDAVPDPRRGASGNQHDYKQQREQVLQFSLTDSFFKFAQALPAVCACRSRYSFKMTAAATASTVILACAFFGFLPPVSFSSRMNLP